MTAMLNTTLQAHASALQSAGKRGSIYLLKGRFAPKDFNNGFNKFLRAKYLCEVKFHSLWFCTHLGIALTVRGDKRVVLALEEYLSTQVLAGKVGSAEEVFKGFGTVNYMSTLTLLQLNYYPQPKQRSFGGSRLPRELLTKEIQTPQLMRMHS
ncbi:hypothetical protein [Pseudomonas simiae]|uniref:hypothetical protein n=1 Tax=Pseudomonas simiae TaxID=321846 RepID=UPI00165463DA|nr:hypothetical protein [Pseudomonas simiae]MBC3965350.1 hypothetical protein [Pseudomonas simiae]WLG36110.1 hypothetical protein PSH82_10170 [Pseudomonas simiae]WLI26045.1 hypothetical protein PSH85_10195 [Pseudomonas simiae]